MISRAPERDSECVLPPLLTESEACGWAGQCSGVSRLQGTMTSLVWAAGRNSIRDRGPGSFLQLGPHLTALPHNATWGFGKGTTFLSQATCDALTRVWGRERRMVPGVSSHLPRTHPSGSRAGLGQILPFCKLP